MRSCGDMRFLLAVALMLISLWLYKAQTSNVTWSGNPCMAVSTSEAAVSLLLSPLSLYSWLTYTLFTLILSAPTLFLTSLYHSLLLLLAWPWCVLNICASFLLTCLHVALYLLLLALAVGLVAVFSLTRLAVGDTNNEKVLYQQKIVEIRHTKTRLRMFARRILQRG